ncbi:acetyl-CoA acetyltransferase [Zopfia rhizophila CBS 207.26]|uniref:Acetyl-CoA acetyltransferase n=1 Tax=Zopfia rhizophila CBS 207.26 TaxID=1314779 RepID=A0A6A6EAC8_9PEZI|nr:acetyl-CoA acetyltransferase [Zopfia rhizophila CBS 207.26]
MATPIVIGVGDIKNRSTKVEDALEPAELMFRAIRAAVKDTNISPPEQSKLQSSIDSIDVVRTWTWLYPDLPGLLAEKLNVRPKHKYYSEHGGNQPGKLFDEAAGRIAQGKTKVAVVTGGEALASLSACAAAKRLPPPGWTPPTQTVDSVFTPTGRDLGDNLGAIHDIGAPIHVYPLYENAFRAHRGQSINRNNKESAELYAEFSAVAEKQQYAWNYGKKDDEETIGTVTKKNRMICFPYPLLMNAFNTINLAGACILTSTSYAKELRIPQDRWIYPLGGAGTKDADDFWKRPNFYTSPSISRSLDSALQVSGVSKEEIDIFDFYSCFPIVPKLASHHLGLPITKSPKPITLLGGLTSFGGAGNNYSMHALTEMTRALRSGKGKKGLVLANGGVLSYQHVVVLSSTPRMEGAYPEKNLLPKETTDIPSPQLEFAAEGDAVIETYTIEFNRDGSPLRAYIVGRLKSNNHRFLANHGDESTLRQMANSDSEIIGKMGWVMQDPRKKGRGLFTFEKGARI